MIFRAKSIIQKLMVFYRDNSPTCKIEMVTWRRIDKNLVKIIPLIQLVFFRQQS